MTFIGYFFAEKLRIAMNETETLKLEKTLIQKLLYESRNQTDQYRQDKWNDDEKLRVAMNETETMKLENELIQKLLHESKNQTDQCRQDKWNDGEKLRVAMNETESLKLKKTIIQKLLDESRNKTDQCRQDKRNDDHPLQPTENIIISIIRHLENIREIGFCVGSSTSIGYVTSKSCCLADEFFLTDAESFENIPYEENSIWIAEELCLINTTTLSDLDFPTIGTNETRFCSLITFDHINGVLKEQQLSINTNECYDKFCPIATIPNFQNETIMEGTSLICVDWPHFGVVRKSKLDNLLIGAQIY